MNSPPPQKTHYDYVSRSLWGRLTVAATVVGVFYYREFSYENLSQDQKTAVDEVKAQLAGFLDQAKKSAGM